MVSPFGDNMKIPSDEEIEAESDNEPENNGFISGAIWMREQLKPLLDLVAELREARKEFDLNMYTINASTAESAAEFINNSRLRNLRDKLELGE